MTRIWSRRWVAGLLATGFLVMGVWGLGAAPAAAQAQIHPPSGPLMEATVGRFYETHFGARPVTPPLGRFELVEGALPAGLELRENGHILGTPRVAGEYVFSLRAVDAGGAGSPARYSLRVAPGSITASPTSLPALTVGAPFEVRLSASGGRAPYVFNMMTGALPTGVYVEYDGRVHGAPGLAGEFRFIVEIRDADDNRGFADFTARVAPPTLRLSPATLRPAVMGAPYNQSMGATGGAGGYLYRLTGELPMGMTFQETGRLSGTPRNQGRFALTIQVTDGSGYSISRDYTLTVGPPGR